ncbi:HNH endonuclease [Sphingobacterium alkalisoli]|uniref:HNH endonuclease n=1 Tax=Sphingobacterium alkalisoli TaxID=1874115 RepID=A0A4V5LXV4_9SPHI|nr:HNH endonuclease [Sphingobacterium alkalisoli]TJY62549.1 HNH endonuclease [Sphingobacterium alkalisoli]GGH27379.1 hypothetical protein GCM10011418_37280 [Sphingobacterium alkalisoli]
MAISDKTRKFLWAKSGNRCAICKAELITSTVSFDEFNLGEECHIISSKPTGPRHIPSLEEYDNYENLLLLCKNHHKEIDELTDTYTEELLRYIKTNHENWVKNTIKDAIDKEQKDEEPKFLSRITSGKDLFNIINEVYGYRTDYDDIKSEEEMNFIGGFIQALIDYGDISGMIEAHDKVRIGYELQKLIDEIENKGYYIFGERGLEPMFSHQPKSDKWTVATIIIKRKENPEIIKIDLENLANE